MGVIIPDSEADEELETLRAFTSHGSPSRAESEMKCHCDSSGIPARGLSDHLARHGVFKLASGRLRYMISYMISRNYDIAYDIICLELYMIS